MGICAGERDKYNAYLNTALTTTLNWDTKILTAEADLVTAHELGHNWGAGHDNDPKEDYNPSEYQCEPGPPNGKYIMYRNAVSGIFQNNKKFSPCSKFDVLSKLLACGRSSFEMLNEDKCGNYKVNTGEQCDSGIGLSNFSKLFNVIDFKISYSIYRVSLIRDIYLQKLSFTQIQQSHQNSQTFDPDVHETVDFETNF